MKRVFPIAFLAVSLVACKNTIADTAAVETTDSTAVTVDTAAVLTVDTSKVDTAK